MINHLIGLFFCVVAHRLFSGGRNGSYYRQSMFPELEQDRFRTKLLAALGTALALGCYFATLSPTPGYLPFDREWASIAGAASAIASITLSTRLGRFSEKTGVKVLDDLHLLTWAEQATLYGAALAFGPTWQTALALALATWPAVFVQKVGINILTEQAWNFNGTDDPTGNTWGIPSLGLKIPRTSQGFRAVASLLCLLGLCVLVLTSCERGPNLKAEWPVKSPAEDTSRVTRFIITHDTVFKKVTRWRTVEAEPVVDVWGWGDGVPVFEPGLYPTPIVRLDTSTLILPPVDSLAQDTALLLPQSGYDSTGHF